MDLRDCILLKTLYQERNITKAAEKLFTSQPALTYRLRQIEEKFQAKIVERTNKGVKFTLEGEHIVRFATKMLDEFSRTKDYVTNMSGEFRGAIKVAAASNFAQYLIPSLLQRFSEMYPSVQINLETGRSQDAFKKIIQNEVHVSIIRGNYSWVGEQILIHQERICLISKTPIDFNDLPNLPRIFFVTEQYLHLIINSWWTENYREPPNIVIQADKVEACRDLAKTGLGYTILPEICLNQEIYDTMHVYPLKNKQNEPILHNTWLLYRKDARKLSIIDAFISFIEEEIKKGESFRVIHPD